MFFLGKGNGRFGTSFFGSIPWGRHPVSHGHARCNFRGIQNENKIPATAAPDLHPFGSLEHRFVQTVTRPAVIAIDVHWRISVLLAWETFCRMEKICNMYTGQSEN